MAQHLDTEKTCLLKACQKTVLEDKIIRARMSHSRPMVKTGLIQFLDPIRADSYKENMHTFKVQDYPPASKEDQKPFLAHAKRQKTRNAVCGFTMFYYVL
jgi:hypothetical protein